MAWLNQLLETLLLTMRDVIPIAVILFGFQLGVLKRPIANWKTVVLGFVYVTFGLSFFLVGLELALFPIGENLANQLTSPSILHPDGSAGPYLWQDYLWVYVFAAAIGFSTTIAEPSLIAVAIKANEVSGGGIWYFARLLSYCRWRSHPLLHHGRLCRGGDSNLLCA